MEFPPILVINLPERKDRWAAIEKMLKPTGLIYERVKAVKRKPGWKGCSLSHRKCIEIAKERGYPWVLILEDDCLLQPGWQKRFQDLLPELWQKRFQWEIFNGGPSHLHKAEIVSTDPPLFRMKCWGTQFILVHEHTYNKILRDVGEHLKIDVYYVESMKNWCTWPHIATQQITYSDIEHEVRDLEPAYEKTSQILEAKLAEARVAPTQRGIAGTLVVSALGLLAYIFNKRR